MTSLLLAWAGLAAGFTLMTLGRLERRRPPAPTPGAALPPVLLVRPADGLAPHELAALATPIDWPAGLEHVVCAPERPVLPPAVRWLRSDPATPNRKVGHLLHALAAIPAGDRAIVAVDVDVAVDARLLAALVAPLGTGAALVTAAPAPEPAPGLGPRAVRALLRHTHQSFAAIDVVGIGPPASCGKAMALGTAACRELGRLRDRVGEDLELAKRLHARGERVVLAGAPARVLQRPFAPLGAAVGRFVRWMQVLRAHRPALLPAVPLLFAPSLPLALAAAVWPSLPLSLAVGLLWGARTALAARMDRDGFAAWPLGEALLLAAFCCALPRRTVVWRGRTFRLARHGRMEPLAASIGMRR